MFGKIVLVPDFGSDSARTLPFVIPARADVMHHSPVAACPDRRSALGAAIFAAKVNETYTGRASARKSMARGIKRVFRALPASVGHRERQPLRHGRRANPTFPLYVPADTEN